MGERQLQKKGYRFEVASPRPFLFARFQSLALPCLRPRFLALRFPACAPCWGHAPLEFAIHHPTLQLILYYDERF